MVFIHLFHVRLQHNSKGLQKLDLIKSPRHPFRHLFLYRLQIRSEKLQARRVDSVSHVTVEVSVELAQLGVGSFLFIERLIMVAQGGFHGQQIPPNVRRQYNLRKFHNTSFMTKIIYY